MLTVNAYQRLELTNSGELPLGEGSQASSSQHLSWIKKLVSALSSSNTNHNHDHITLLEMLGCFTEFKGLALCSSLVPGCISANMVLLSASISSLLNMKCL